MQTHTHVAGLCRVAPGELPAQVWGRADWHGVHSRCTKRLGQTQPSPPSAKPEQPDPELGGCEEEEERVCEEEHGHREEERVRGGARA